MLPPGFDPHDLPFTTPEVLDAFDRMDQHTEEFGPHAVIEQLADLLGLPAVVDQGPLVPPGLPPELAELMGEFQAEPVDSEPSVATHGDYLNSSLTAMIIHVMAQEGPQGGPATAATVLLVAWLVATLAVENATGRNLGSVPAEIAHLDFDADDEAN